MIRATHIIFVLALGLAAWVTVMPPGPMTQDQGLTFGIMLMTLTLWGTGIVPGYVGAAFLMVALLLTGLQGPDVVFGSFSSSATWLVVAGFVIGAAITHTGWVAAWASWRGPMSRAAMPR